MWRINREAVLLGAGPTALLLQIAHPHVAEGVAHHSTFESDPWKRLHGTLATTLDLIFGDTRRAERAVRRLNRIHAGVRGNADDPVAVAVAGPSYRALDPALLLWVQATLFRTSVEAYAAWVRPLTEEDIEAYWQETRQVGQRLGIPLSLSPVDSPAFSAYWDRMLDPSGPIHVTPTARRLSRLIVRPPLPALPAPVVDLLALPAIGLLPPRIRDEYGLPWGQPHEPLFRLASAGLRAYVNALPRSWRAMPQARAAERRVGRAAGPPRVGRIAAP